MIIAEVSVWHNTSENLFLGDWEALPKKKLFDKTKKSQYFEISCECCNLFRLYIESKMLFTVAKHWLEKKESL